ncbi:hypothetical protein ADL22_19800 [Streptomyces sp. NRRL F-4489]|uniref:hypothetical protein n=1 Tax=Streptomyces sp. NRRL F-4489 TaxID=1609095 RepID=UPI00074B0CE8|nr:hypothetical protein [Streptomyces sp. NRRL F-4489]KUL37885.1 hypothetical protein ADL22_19800 [Streptomyces sp. NRRL F-4489]
MEETGSRPDDRAVRTAPAPAAGRPPGGRPAARPLPWLAGLGAAFTLLQLLLVVPGSGLGWDETVYAGQVVRDVPAPFFSAPRARGITYLLAPAAALTSDTTALRITLAVLSGAGLCGALWIWRRLLPVRVLVLGGALFATLWITLYYGPQAMPNLWSAYGALAATGCFLRAVRDRADRRALAGLPLAVAVAALMRPPDAVWLVLPLALAALAVPAWRRPVLLPLMAGGLLLGAADWIAEAYLRFGGLAARLHRAAEIQGGIGWHLAVDDQIRSLDGRGLCRPCDVPWSHPGTAVWWFALPLLTAGGALAAARARRLPTALLPAAVALATAVPYLFLIDYAAPRFLLPAYALLALPAADCLWRLAAPGGRLRARAAAVTAAALAAHLAVQFAVLTGNTARNRHMRQDFTAAAATLHRLGVRPPCVLSGDHAVQLAYYAGCASRQTAGPDTALTPGALRAAAARRPVAVLVPPPGARPAVARGWRPAALAAAGRFRGYRVYLSPPPGGAARPVTPGRSAPAG